jgi:hypothetical protein
MAWHDVIDTKLESFAVRNPFQTIMSQPAKKAKDTKALPLSDTLRDLALLRASDVDLAALLPANSTNNSNASDGAVEESVANSSEFIKEARKALKVQDRGQAEIQGKKLDVVRSKFEDVLAGLEHESA